MSRHYIYRSYAFIVLLCRTEVYWLTQHCQSTGSVIQAALLEPSSHGYHARNWWPNDDTRQTALWQAKKVLLWKLLTHLWHVSNQNIFPALLKLMRNVALRQAPESTSAFLLKHILSPSSLSIINRPYKLCPWKWHKLASNQDPSSCPRPHKRTVCIPTFSLMVILSKFPMSFSTLSMPVVPVPPWTGDVISIRTLPNQKSFFLYALAAIMTLGETLLFSFHNYLALYA